jgi:transposase, IS30 family
MFTARRPKDAALHENMISGGWEGDTVEGAKGKGGIASLVERKSCYLLAAPLPDKSAATMMAQTSRALMAFPQVIPSCIGKYLCSLYGVQSPRGLSHHRARRPFGRSDLHRSKPMQVRIIRKTLTVDNGKEFAQFKLIQQRTGFSVFFADPYSAWQRGSNENTNGLLRQYFPKGADLRTLTKKRLASALERLNHRPRKCLGYRTPHEVLNNAIRGALQT